jgi:hypothetical protein
MGWTTGESGFDSAGSEGEAEIFLVSINNTNQLMLSRGIIPVYSEKHMKYITSLCVCLCFSYDSQNEQRFPTAWEKNVSCLKLNNETLIVLLWIMLHCQ